MPDRKKTYRVERVVRVLEQVTVEARTKAEAYRRADVESWNKVTTRVDVHLGKWRADG